ncbi:MAG: hypothetical protein MHPSP_002700, partial [Paramarteilia canceri]
MNYIDSSKRISNFHCKFKIDKDKSKYISVAEFDSNPKTRERLTCLVLIESKVLNYPFLIVAGDKGSLVQINLKKNKYYNYHSFSDGVTCIKSFQIEHGSENLIFLCTKSSIIYTFDRDLHSMCFHQIYSLKNLKYPVNYIDQNKDTDEFLFTTKVNIIHFKFHTKELKIFNFNDLQPQGVCDRDDFSQCFWLDSEYFICFTESKKIKIVSKIFANVVYESRIESISQKFKIDSWHRSSEDEKTYFIGIFNKTSIIKLQFDLETCEISEKICFSNSNYSIKKLFLPNNVDIKNDRVVAVDKFNNFGWVSLNEIFEEKFNLQKISYVSDFPSTNLFENSIEIAQLNCPSLDCFFWANLGRNGNFHVIKVSGHLPKPNLIKFLQYDKNYRVKNPSSKKNTDIKKKTKAIIINKSHIKGIIKEFGSIPDKFRLFVWKNLLKLPENKLLFKSLQKSIIKNQNIYAKTESRKHNKFLCSKIGKVLDTLKQWAKITAEFDFLPIWVEFLSNIYECNFILCFETVVSILVNYCSDWFHYYPNPPFNILAEVENLVAMRDPKLIELFKSRKITSDIYIWPVLKELFLNNFNLKDRLIMFDNIFVNEPRYLTCLAASFSSVWNSKPLINEVISLADIMYNEAKYHCAFSDSTMKSTFKPLDEKVYPVFEQIFPRMVSDYFITCKERLRVEEEEYLRRREALLNLEKKKHEAPDYLERQKRFLSAENKRRQLLMKENTLHEHKKQRLAELSRRLRSKELQILENETLEFDKYQDLLKETTLKRMEDETICQ